MRARILREKEERRKKQLSGQLTDTHDSSSGSPSKESANREVRTVRTSQVVTQRPDTTRTTAVVAADTTGGHTKKSIYINPKAFRGDLSALKGVAKTSNAATGSQSNAVVRASVRTQIGASTGTRATGSETGGVTTGQQKKRTILRIVRNKKGEIISKSKVKSFIIHLLTTSWFTYFLINFLSIISKFYINLPWLLFTYRFNVLCCCCCCC